MLRLTVKGPSDHPVYMIGKVCDQTSCGQKEHRKSRSAFVEVHTEEKIQVEMTASH